MTVCAGAADGSASDDDFQQAWSQEAEDVLVAAWNSTKAVSGQQGLHELAVDVCKALGNTAVQVGCRQQGWHQHEHVVSWLSAGSRMLLNCIAAWQWCMPSCKICRI